MRFNCLWTRQHTVVIVTKGLNGIEEAEIKTLAKLSRFVQNILVHQNVFTIFLKTSSVFKNGLRKLSLNYPQVNTKLYHIQNACSSSYIAAITSKLNDCSLLHWCMNFTILC